MGGTCVWDDDMIVEWKHIMHLLPIHDEYARVFLHLDAEGPDDNGDWQMWCTCWPYEESDPAQSPRKSPN